MDEYTLSVTNKWIKERSGELIEGGRAGSPECGRVHAFNVELQTLKDVWAQLLNIESIRARNSSFPYMSKDDFCRLVSDMGLKLKETEVDELLSEARKEEDGAVMIFESMLALAERMFQREENPYKPNELLKKLMRTYLRPLQLQCNWLMYRDQGKVWIP